MLRLHWLALVACAAAQAPPLEELRETALQMPESAPAQSNFGTGLKAVGRLDEAFDRFEEAIRLDPDYTQARMNLAKVLGGRERAE